MSLAIPQYGARRRVAVLEAEHHAHEIVAPSRIVCRPQLQHHLLLGAELQLLQVRALGRTGVRDEEVDHACSDRLGVGAAREEAR
jgi:hypothetical protein